MDGNKQFQASFIVQQYVEIFSRDSSSQDSSLDSVPVFFKLPSSSINLSQKKKAPVQNPPVSQNQQQPQMMQS